MTQLVDETGTRLFTAIAKGYPLEDVRTFAADALGTNVHVPFQATGSDGRRRVYLATMYPKKSAAQVSTMCRVMRVAGDNGVTVPLPIKANNESDYVIVDGEPVVVKKWIEGASSTAIQAGHSFEAGAILSRVHDIPLTPELLSVLCPGDRIGTRCKQDLEAVKASNAQLGGFLERLRNETKGFDQTSRYDFVLSHGDYFPHQLVESDRSNVSLGVLDWEDSAIEPSGHDLAWALVGFSFDGDDNFVPGRGRSFLDGYETIRPLTSAQKADLPTGIRWAATVIATRRAAKSFADHPSSARRPWQAIVPLLEPRAAEAILTSTPISLEPRMLDPQPTIALTQEVHGSLTG